MGLFMDGDGLPLSSNIYPGNMNEQKTLIPEETKIVDNFKLDDSKIILCTDAGLASDDIKNFNIKDNRGFVITQSLKKLKEEDKNKVFDKSEWRIPNDLKNTYNLEDIENNDSLKEKYYDTLFYKIIQTETKSVKQDLIVTFCFKYFDYNRNIRNNQIERAKKSIESNQVTRKGKNQNDYRRFVETTISTNNGEIAENTTIESEPISKEDGKYCYIPTTHKVTLGRIAELLYMFNNQANTFIMPEIPNNSFEKKLYSTYLSYLPVEKVKYKFNSNVDERGSFTELCRQTFVLL